MNDFMAKYQHIVKTHNKRIILPEAAEDERVIRAADEITRSGYVKIILVGDSEIIKQNQKKYSLKLNNVTIVDNNLDSRLEKYTAQLYELRKSKGLNMDEARILLKKPIYFATMMLYNDEADGIVSGAACPTADTLKPALQIIKTKPGIQTASSYFIMLWKDKVFFNADCAFVVDPDAKQLADIAISTADSAKNYGIEPKVAMLSFSTKGSAKHPSVDKVVEATNIVKAKRPDIIIDGEMQFDAAIIPFIAEKKCHGSAIKGDANVMIFPDLNAGNIAYKITERLGGAQAIGPIVQGLNKPVNDLSRGCSIQDIVDVVVLTAMQTMKK